MRGRSFFMALVDQHLGRVAAAELPLPIPAPEPDAEPLVLAEPPLLPPLPLASVELLPLIEEPEAEPDAADFSFGWPVAWSRQWVAAEIEPEPVPDGLLPD